VLDTFTSEAGSPGDLDTDSTPTAVVIGDTLTLAETLAATNAANYQSTLACTGAADTVLSDGLTIGPGETAIVCTFTNTRIVPLTISKTSSVLSDGINAAGPKAIPGATIRYCILVANPGTLPASSVSVTDSLPAQLAYIAGTARTGPSCAAANGVEDEDALGSDESDPFGFSFDGTALIGTAATLGAGASFALLFHALLN